MYYMYLPTEFHDDLTLWSDAIQQTMDLHTTWIRDALAMDMDRMRYTHCLVDT